MWTRGRQKRRLGAGDHGTRGARGTGEDPGPLVGVRGLPKALTWNQKEQPGVSHLVEGSSSQACSQGEEEETYRGGPWGWGGAHLT